MTALLYLESVSVSYDKAIAVEDVTLGVGQGQIVSVIGPNGAGKTSLLHAIMGALPSTGTIRFDNRVLGRTSLQERVRAGLALVPETRALFGAMTVRDNLLLGAFRRRHDGAAATEAALEDIYGIFPRLRERSGQHAHTLSGGERQMLALGRALLGRPRLLMLDEPSLGLAPRIVQDILRTLLRLRESGVSILLVEQNARAALNISDYAYVIEQGRVRMEGAANALRENPDIVATYLGLAGAPAIRSESGRLNVESN